jgi:hypothetical protein
MLPVAAALLQRLSDHWHTLPQETQRRLANEKSPTRDHYAANPRTVT